MKTITKVFEKVKTRIKARPKITIQTLTKYAVIFATMVLFANAKMIGGLSPFSLGFFVGLVFAKQNMFVIAPLYVLAALTGDFSTNSLIFAISPIIVLSVVYIIFYRMSRSVGLAVLTVASLVSMIPYMVITLIATDAYLTVFLNVLLTVFFAYCSQIGLYALLLRGVNFRLSLDELVSLSTLLLAVSLSLFSNPIFGFNLFFVFFCFVTLFLTFSFPPSITLLASVIMGLGGTLVSGDISLVAVCVLLSATSVVLKDFTKYASALGIILVDSLLALYVGIVSFDYFQLIAVAVGVALFLLVPRTIMQTLAAALGGLNSGRASRTIVNQNRVELSSKLQNVSRVFWNMSALLSSSNPSAERYKPDKLAESIACSYCTNCADHESCFSALGTDTRGVLLPMVEASLSRNKVTILDMPPFITSRCSHMQGLVNTINHTGEKAKHELGSLNDTTESRMLISEQFGGVSVVLDTLAKDIKKRVSFSPDREAKITRELARHNIIAKEVVVYGDGKGCQVTLVVREGDTNKLVLDKLVSNALGCKMERVPQELTTRDAHHQTGEWRIVQLQTAPLYNVAFGIAERKRETEDVSGDSKIITNLSDGKQLIALCDGMGSGKNALNSSATAIALIENFFRAGFESPLVLSLINRMLALRNSDDYSTLDLVVVDRMTGELDLVKMGAADSFIVHGEEIQVIESGTPPVGILDKITPITMRITMQDTDMVVLVSDGICDNLTSDGVAAVIERTNSLNPQTLADALITEAVARGATDDCTAVVFRLVTKV